MKLGLGLLVKISGACLYRKHIVHLISGVIDLW